ncbi:MAG: TRAM domain-containing protein [Clostridiales bacterium]|nr:TRAM domain-containing protein [Clostridiales bacterium]
MNKNKGFRKMMKVLIVLLGAGIGAAIAAFLVPLGRRFLPDFFNKTGYIALTYFALCLIGAFIFFALSNHIVDQIMKIMARLERFWEMLSTRQLILGILGILAGLIIAWLISQPILSMGISLVSISLSALLYLLCGYVGMRIGFRRTRKKRKASAMDPIFQEASSLLSDEDEETESPFVAKGMNVPCKLLDTSVIIDGRVLDVAKAGFLEGEIVVPEFVLAELRHIADSGDNLRRARGRRGLDVLQKLQKELKNPITIEQRDYPDVEEVDVKLLRLCREKDGTVVTNDYNLNKVASVAGLRVMNINDLANAVKPMLMAGEELTVQIVREGKEPGQGVAYLDDGTMIVVDNGRRHVGEEVTVVVTTVLQTSAGRMIFTKLLTAEDKGVSAGA